MVFALFYTGGRISEATTLTLGMNQPAKGGVIGWPQPKKDYATRDAILPDEAWLWHSKVDPSIDWYLTHVRPEVAKTTNPQDPLWLNSKGEPFTENGARNFVREGIAIALGGNGRGPHRASAGAAPRGATTAAGTWKRSGSSSTTPQPS